MCPSKPPTRPEFDADYYLRGPQTGKSLYDNYRWLPELTLPLADRIVSWLGIEKDDSVLDFGCARGYLVKAFRKLGYEARGVDASAWAIENADPGVREFVEAGVSGCGVFDWTIAKDVLEHVPEDDLFPLVRSLLACSEKGFFAVVPLSEKDGEPYVVPAFERDVTHVIRKNLCGWAELFVRASERRFSVDCRYHVPGVKDAYAEYTRGNGFITCHRLVSQPTSITSD